VLKRKNNDDSALALKIASLREAPLDIPRPYIEAANDSSLYYKKRRLSDFGYVVEETRVRTLKIKTGMPEGLLIANKYFTVYVLDAGHILVVIEPGYAWDGPSGPVFHTKTWMDGSLFHDLGYQLMRMGILPRNCKNDFDRAMQQICIEKGMWKFRAWYSYQGVHYFGHKYTKSDLLAA